MKNLSFCIIDDCRGIDVPLVELIFSSVFIERGMESGIGRMKAIIAGDYYNQALSGWEPFLEPWK